MGKHVTDSMTFVNKRCHSIEVNQGEHAVAIETDPPSAGSTCLYCLYIAHVNEK